MQEKDSKKYPISKRDSEYNSTHTTTTFQMTRHLHTKLRMMCMLTHKSMGEFIRLAIVDKINALEVGKVDEQG